ncbi:hypothetical protein PaeBR_01065 [Paenibacillus sp. BR2-3]|uniref:hypothetical protein n=1 Tax=Paenibacillus sp. BR2-3 TaxID=3048494 RepID=UPI003977AD43
MEEPWVFDVTVPTSQMAIDTKTFTIDKAITLNNGEKVTLEKVIASPVSTLIYFDLTQASESTRFKLVTASGEKVPLREGYGSRDIGETSYGRYTPLDLEKETYLLVPINEDGEEIGPQVILNLD